MWKQSIIMSNEIMKLCEILAEYENLRVSVTEASKGALSVGFGALAGALLGGPIGLGIGGTIASITTAYRSRYSYRSVVDVLRNDLNPHQKSKLINAVREQIKKVKPTQCINIIEFVLFNSSLKTVVLKEIVCFLVKEMKMKMIE